MKKTWLIKTFVALIVFCMSLLIYNENAMYVEINLPAPLANLPNGGWDEVLYIRKSFVGEYGRTLILRKEGRAYGTGQGYNFSSQEGILKYYENYLVERGWTTVPRSWDDVYKCRDGFPEKEYIAGAMFQEYIKNGIDPENATQRICVAIISDEPYASTNQQTFHVILISSRLSFITTVLESFSR